MKCPSCFERVNSWASYCPACGEDLPQIAVLTGDSQELVAVRFTPDGRVVAAAVRDQSLQRWEMATGQPLPGRRGGLPVAWAAAVSPDGRLLAAGGRDSPELQLWGLGASGALEKWKVPGDGVAALAYSPVGKTLAAAGFNHRLSLWEVTAATPAGW